LMNIPCPLGRYLWSARWLNRVQSRHLSRAELYQELLAKNQRGHIQRLLPAKTGGEVEVVRRIRNEIWGDLSGGMCSFFSIYRSPFGLTAKAKRNQTNENAMTTSKPSSDREPIEEMLRCQSTLHSSRKML
jgi:hypothetical protein